MSARTASRPERASQGVADKGVKFTFVLPTTVAQQLRAAVEKGAAPLQNALVREALRREMKRLREEEIASAMREAANDPLYMQDLEECMRDFAELDRDALQHLDCEMPAGENEDE